MKTELIKIGTCYLVRVGRLRQPCRVIAMRNRIGRPGVICTVQNLVTNRILSRTPRQLQTELSETLAERLTIIRKSV